MLVFIPISWALHFTHQGSVIIFIFSMFAVVPLAALLGFA
jgi:Ca2+:H+ antiporter